MTLNTATHWKQKTKLQQTQADDEVPPPHQVWLQKAEQFRRHVLVKLRLMERYTEGQTDTVIPVHPPHSDSSTPSLTLLQENRTEHGGWGPSRRFTIIKTSTNMWSAIKVK